MNSPQPDGPRSRPIASPLAILGWRAPKLLLLAGVLTGTGCPSPDPERKFDDFLEQTEEEREDAGAMPDFGGALADISGTFYLAVAASLAPTLPLQFVTDVTLEIAPDGSGGTMDLTLQPLSLDPGQTLTPREPVGDPFMFADIPVDAAGTFVLDTGEITLPGAANPISGSPIVATIILNGNIQSEDLWCGTADGMVTSPINNPLEGSTFAAVRIEDAANLPDDIVVMCPEAGADETGGTAGETGGTAGETGGEGTGTGG